LAGSCRLNAKLKHARNTSRGDAAQLKKDAILPQQTGVLQILRVEVRIHHMKQLMSSWKAPRDRSDFSLFQPANYRAGGWNSTLMST
jgi:hypothetical protein